MSDLLTDFITRHERIFVLTGAGVSTASGIPDYRDDSGDWKHQKPIEYRDFVDHYRARQRYWARSYVGWQRFSLARPNAAHRALTGLEKLGLLTQTVTQNVDGLHQAAGSRDVTELHGSLARVRCLDCGYSISRVEVQARLLDLNPMLAGLQAALAPDGDAQLAGFKEDRMIVPDCHACGGRLKPDVVFFGESVPKQRVQQAFAALSAADAMLVVGSSLMLFSGFRFVREAKRAGLPIAALNQGRTRADEMLDLKLRQDCGSTLKAVLSRIDSQFAG